MLSRRTSASLGQAVRGQQQLRSSRISSDQCNGQRWMSHWRSPATSGTFVERALLYIPTLRCCVWVMGRRITGTNTNQPSTIPASAPPSVWPGRSRQCGRDALVRERLQTQSQRERRRRRESQNRGIGRAYARSSSSGPRILQGVRLDLLFFLVLAMPWHAIRASLCCALHARRALPHGLAWLFFYPSPLPFPSSAAFFLLQVAFPRIHGKHLMGECGG